MFYGFENYVFPLLHAYTFKIILCWLYALLICMYSILFLGCISFYFTFSITALSSLPPTIISLPYLHFFYSILTTAASDITGSTCIHRVAFLGLTEVGKLLLAGGCPIDAVNVEGDAATHIAAREVRTSGNMVYTLCFVCNDKWN